MRGPWLSRYPYNVCSRKKTGGSDEYAKSQIASNCVTTQDEYLDCKNQIQTIPQADARMDVKDNS